MWNWNWHLLGYWIFLTTGAGAWSVTVTGLDVVAGCVREADLVAGSMTMAGIDILAGSVTVAGIGMVADFVIVACCPAAWTSLVAWEGLAAWECGAFLEGWRWDLGAWTGLRKHQFIVYLYCNYEIVHNYTKSVTESERWRSRRNNARTEDQNQTGSQEEMSQ